MPNETDSHLTQANEYWRGGHPLEAGKLIYENLPADIRPKWASRILKLVLLRSGIRSSPIEQVLDIADHTAKWGNANRAFFTVRKSTLKLDSIRDRGLTKKQELLGWGLALAELVAKVTYNATNPPDEFDEDSGWWIAPCLKGFLDLLNDDDFSNAAWSALCCEASGLKTMSSPNRSTEGCDEEKR